MTDGRAGNVAQALGLAEAMIRQRNAEVSERIVTLRPWAARLPASLVWLLGARQDGWPFTIIAEGAADLHAPWPDVIIGTGRRVAPIAAALRRLHGIKAIQILDPQMPLSAFDVVVVPRHDGLSGSNVMQTNGSINRMTGRRIAAEATDWADKLTTHPAPRIAALIGGPSKSAAFGEEVCDQILSAISTLSQRFSLLVTPSRRTPEDLVRRLKSVVGNHGFVWDGKGKNPFPAILGHADAVLVTEDSVNMTSEAASSGLPVHVMPVGTVAPKIRRFHESMEERGATRRFKGTIDHWFYQPLAEADRIAAHVLREGLV